MSKMLELKNHKYVLSSYYSKNYQSVPPVYISITEFSFRFRFGEGTLYSQTLIFAWMCWKGSWVYPLLLFLDISMYV